MGHPVRGRHRAFVRNGWFVCFGYTTALADLAGGKPARKVLVNSAQLAIALGAAGVVCLATGGHPVSPGDHPGGPPGPPGSGDVSLPAFAAAALAFFVVNNLLVEAVLVLAAPRGPRPWAGSARGWARVSAMLLGMAPGERPAQA